MPKRSSKRRPADLNRLAASIVGEAVGDTAPTTEPEKNPAAVELGRMGGLKGGPARDKALSDERKSEIAREAAKARWAKRGKASS